MRYKLLFCLAALAFVAVTTATTNKSEEEEVRKATNAFAIDLYQTARPNNTNWIISPLSTIAVMAMLWTGAQGNTATEMQKVLHLCADRERVAKGIRHIFDNFQKIKVVDVRLAVKMYIDEKFTVKKPFQDRSVKFFRSDIEKVAFFKNEDARIKINKWIAEKTDNKIKNFYPIDSLAKDSLLVLVNAAFFKGSWLHPFREKNSKMEKFHVSRTSTIEVKMMHGHFVAGFQDFEELGVRLVAFPYQEMVMRMLIFLPNEVDGLSRLEENLQKINFERLILMEKPANLKVPKFKIRSSVELKKNLGKLGMRRLIVDPNLNDLSDNTLLRVDDMTHKAFIDVNENGTVAAAATGISILPRSTPELFHCDHPFLFVIQGSDKTILFIGKVTRPTYESQDT